MRPSRTVTAVTVFFFLFFTWFGSNPGLFGDTSDDPVISNLLEKAENHYQNGQFKEAIDIYEQIISELNKRKELVKTKQKLFSTMLSLALTYYTIQETGKSREQLEKLIGINPNQEIDKEVYPPKFVSMFNEVRDAGLGELVIRTTPAGASVMIDNKRAGTAPLTLENYPKGEYNVTLSLKGYESAARKVTVNPGSENTLEVTLVAEAQKTALEKPGVKKKKKKGSPVLIIGGVLVAAAAVLLLTGKKKEETVQVYSRQFTNDTPVPINPWVPSYSVLEAAGITGQVRKVEFSITIAHPRIEDLAITLVGTDNRTLFNVWNKGPHEDGGKVFTGTTEVFNTIAPNGSWKVTVTNSGERSGGEIVRWWLKIYYAQ